MERRTIRGLHTFLVHLPSGVDPVPMFTGITLYGVDCDETVHLLHYLLSVPVIFYFMARRLFAFLEEILYEGLPPDD